MVRARTYSPWTTDRLVIDTARLTPDEALTAIARHLDGLSVELAGAATRS
jgi:Mrp family chromosome partitioning ATPase